MLFMDYGFGAPVKKAVAKSAPVVKKSLAVVKAPPRPKVTLPRKPPAAGRPAPKAKPTADAGVTKLQHTLNSLAQRTGDSALSLKVDGLIGPKTAAATNRALVKYGAVAGAPAEVRTGRLTAAQVKELASDLAFFVEKAVEKSLPKASPAVAKKAEAQKKAVVKKAAATRSDAIVALQRALRTLGVIVEDGALAIAIDGLIGPKTTAAVNRAMTKYVPKPPALYASGTLTQQAVVAAAAELTDLVTGAARAQQTAKQAPAAQGRKPAGKTSSGDTPRVKIPAPYESARPGPAPAPEPEIEEPEIEVPRPAPPRAVVRPPPSAPAAVAPDAVYPPDQRPGADPQLQPPGPTEVKKEIPWPWIIAGGAGVIGLVAVTVLVARRKKR